jgi:uncharacterized membrane protein YjjP (DUF1212 family)
MRGGDRLTNMTELDSKNLAAAPLNPTEKFLLRTAEMLHRHGTPSYRLERVMSTVSASLKIDSSYLYTPTVLVVSFRRGDDERLYLRRIESSAVDVGKLIAFDSILDRLAAGEIDIAEATIELEAASQSSSSFGTVVTAIAAGTACGSVAVLFGGGAVEVVMAAVLGLVIASISVLVERWAGGSGVLEPLLGFCVASVSVLIASAIIPMDDRLVTLAALILPLPGLALTIALTELALGHLSAGSARLAGAGVTLLTLVLGVSIAWRVIPGGMHGVGQAPFTVQLPLAAWAMWPAILIAPAAFAVLFKVPLSQWPVVFAVATSGFLASRFVGSQVAPETGSFVGALVVGCGSNLYARLKNRPAMAAQTPGLLILVPGSIGYRSLVAMLESQTVEGVALAFTMVLVAGSLVGGLLTANLVLPPKRIL